MSFCVVGLRDLVQPSGLEQSLAAHWDSNPSSLNKHNFQRSWHGHQSSKLCLLLTGMNSSDILTLIIHTQPLQRQRHSVKSAVHSVFLRLLRASTVCYCNTAAGCSEKFSTTVAAPEGAQKKKNVEWALSVISVPAPTMRIRALGADMVRIVNPPTLHVTLYNTETVSVLSIPTTHTCPHMPTKSPAGKLFAHIDIDTYIYRERDNWKVVDIKRWSRLQNQHTVTTGITYSDNPSALVSAFFRVLSVTLPLYLSIILSPCCI